MPKQPPAILAPAAHPAQPLSRVFSIMQRGSHCNTCFCMGTCLLLSCACCPALLLRQNRRLCAILRRGLCAATALQVEPFQGAGLPRCGAQVSAIKQRVKQPTAIVLQVFMLWHAQCSVCVRKATPGSRTSLMWCCVQRSEAADEMDLSAALYVVACTVLGVSVSQGYCRAVLNTAAGRQTVSSRVWQCSRSVCASSYAADCRWYSGQQAQG
jgi:hypothetical protein